MTKRIRLVIYVLAMYCQVINAQSYKIELAKADSINLDMQLIVDSIRNIEIQLPEDNILQAVRLVQFTKNERYLIVAGIYKGIYLFDLEGNFIKEITTPSSEYQSPTEATAHNGEFDEENDIFYKDAYDKWIGINIHTGRIVNRIIKPQKYADKIANFCQIAEDYYVGYVNNQSGKEPISFAFFNKNGELLSFVPNHRSYLKYTIDNPYNYGVFYKYQTKYYCFEPSYGTTIYEINDTGAIPYIWFNLGNKCPIYRYRDMPNSNSGCYYISKVIETQSLIHFQGNAGNFPLWGYHDKRNNKTYLISNAKSSLNAEELDKTNYIPFLSKYNKSITYITDGLRIKVLISTLK